MNLPGRELSQRLYQLRAFCEYFLSFRSDQSRLKDLWGAGEWPNLPNRDSQIIKEYRQSLLTSSAWVEKTDFGTGQNKKLPLRRLAAHSSVREVYGKLLFGLVHLRSPKKILELGTCLGVSSLYMIEASQHLERFVSVEGCPGTFSAREEHFAKSGLHHDYWQFLRSEFDPFLAGLATNDTFDLVFVDGNHSYRPTVNYFQVVSKHMEAGGVMIFDDIHWSKGMNKAWREISNDPKVLQAFDLYQFGVVQLR